MKYKYSDELLKTAVADSTSVAEVIRKLGIAYKGGGALHNHISSRIKRLNLDISHFNYYNPLKSNKKRTYGDILVRRNKPNRERSSVLRRALIEYGIEYECSVCKIKNWNNKPITLHIDHIDGDGLNNIIENLRFICPNCHSQTSNFGFRGSDNRCKLCNSNIKKASIHCRSCASKARINKNTKICWPNNLELRELVDRLGYKETGRQLGVSDNAVRKRLNRDRGR